jgi:E3 ubiquitin-protein ligase TRIP12
LSHLIVCAGSAEYCSGKQAKGTVSTGGSGLKKGDTGMWSFWQSSKSDQLPASKQLIDDSMEGNLSWIAGPSGTSSRGFLDDDGGDEDEDEDMEETDGEDDDEHDPEANDYIGAAEESLRGSLGAGLMGHLSNRFGGMDASLAGMFSGSDFRSFNRRISSMSSRFSRLKKQLHSPKSSVRLAALRECSETLLVGTEDTLGGAFSTHSFAAEFIAILKGQPNIDENGPSEITPPGSEELGEDAELAAVLAMSAGDNIPGGIATEDDMECQLLACRCLAHLMEALPGSGHTIVHLGGVRALCDKLQEISYIELAEQTLSVCVTRYASETC